MDKHLASFENSGALPDMTAFVGNDEVVFDWVESMSSSCSDAGEDCRDSCCGQPPGGASAVRVRFSGSADATLDRSLARKFTSWWPPGMAAPTVAPWLGGVVSRKKAWRWVSQFSTHFASIEAHEEDKIGRFIAITLLELDPESAPEARDTGAGKSKCCPGRGGDGGRDVDFGDVIDDCFWQYCETQQGDFIRYECCLTEDMSGHQCEDHPPCKGDDIPGEIVIV